jgi:hypothetical protein
MLFLVPFDAIELRVSSPVDPRIDRFALLALGGLWLVMLLVRGPASPRLRRTPLNWGILGFVAAAALSITINAGLLSRNEELGLAFKKLVLFLAFVLFFYIVSTSLRRREVKAFVTLVVVLASITAIGTTYEFRQGTNYFYEFAYKAAGGPVTVFPEPADPKFGRLNVTGPTAHGLAVTVVLAMALPFALIGLLEARQRRPKYLYALAAGLIFLGCFSTVRKTGVITPIVSVVAMCAYRPREMLRLAPFGVVILVMSQIASPGALTGLRYEFQSGSAQSTSGRTDDFAAVGPDIRKRIAIGRGFGSYDPKIHTFKKYDKRPHRFLDNQYLTLAIEVGLIGVAAFAAMLLSGWAAAHRAALDPTLSRAGPAIAAIAGVAAFAMAASLFDVLAFPQADYMLFLVFGLAVAGSGGLGVRTTPSQVS